MHETFVFPVFGVVTMVLLVVSFLGGLVVDLIFGRLAGLTYIEKTSRVLFEVLGAQMVIWLVMFVVERMVPGQYVTATLTAGASLIALTGTTLVVRNSGFFAKFPCALGRDREAEQPTSGVQPPPEQ